MKLINPILLTLNNTLHIKADNLEPVEVDSSCTSEIRKLSQIKYKKAFGTRIGEIEYYYALNDIGISIQELSDRIEVRKIYVHKRESLNNFVYRAFLLPEKEDKETIKTFTITQTELTGVLINGVRYYPIEEIEKAINGVKLVPHYDEILKIIKKQILNNLKKLTNTY